MLGSLFLNLMPFFSFATEIKESPEVPTATPFQDIPAFIGATDEMQTTLIRDYLKSLHLRVQDIKKLDNKSAVGIFHLAIFDVLLEKKERLIVKVTEKKDEKCREVLDLWEVSLTDFSKNTVKDSFNSKIDKKKKYFWNAFKSLKHAPEFEFPKMMHWAMNAQICVAVMKHADAEPIFYASVSSDARMAEKVVYRLGQMTGSLHFREAPLDLTDLSKTPIWSHGDLHRFNILGAYDAKHFFLIDYADVHQSPNWELSQARSDLEQVTGMRFGRLKFHEEIRHYAESFVKDTEIHTFFPGSTREGRIRWLAQRLSGVGDAAPVDPKQHELIEDRLWGKNQIKDAIPDFVPRLSPFRSQWRVLNENLQQLGPFQKGYLEMTPKGVRPFIHKELLDLCERWIQAFFKSIHIDGPGFETERERFYRGYMKEIKACAQGKSF